MKIIGNTVGTTAMRPDYGQTDSSKSSFIQNKPKQALPPVTTADNTKVLMVVDGVWAAVEIPVAEGGGY